MKYALSSINYICTVDKIGVVSLKLIAPDGNVVDKQYLTNDELDDRYLDKSESVNKTCLARNDYVAIHNMYDSSMVFYKSPLMKALPSNRTGTTYDYLNIFLHEKDNCILTAVNTNDTIYALAPESEYGHSALEVDSYSYLSIDNCETTLPNKKVKTVTYDREVISSLASGVSSISDIGKDKEIKSTLNGIVYSSVLELPGSMQNDYDSGNIGAISFKTKNQYSSEYSMEHTSDEVLKNCRQYVDLGNCNNLVYLKYYDNVDYKYAGRSSTSNEILTRKILRNKGKYDLTIPNIEVIDAIGRYMAPNARHTTLYSLNLKTDLLKVFDREDLKKIKSNLINEIKTNIKKIVNNIAPVLTQLFEVNVNET